MNTAKSNSKKPLISILVPVYNEEDAVERAYSEIKKQLDYIDNSYDYEILFTDNHSTDSTFDILKSLAKKDPKIRILRFIRNHGFQRSVLTGYRHVCGDAAIQIDADLQDPPELIIRFIDEWEKGADVVVGIREVREEPSLLSATRGVFYRLLNAISDDNLPALAGDFRLTDRSVLDQLNYINDASPYVRGIISTLATNEVGISYKRSQREHGKSKFPLRELVRFAIDAIISHSILPLRLATYIGLIIAMLTGMLVLYYLTTIVFFDASWPAGLPTIVILILFGISLNGLLLGVIGEYIGRIYLQLRNRPTTVIEKAINISPHQWGNINLP